MVERDSSGDDEHSDDHTRERRPVGVFENHHSRSIARTGRADDTTKADVRRRRIDRLRNAGGGAVADAVIRRAQMRTALQHLAWDLDLGLAAIVAVLFPLSARVHGKAGGDKREANPAAYTHHR